MKHIHLNIFNIILLCLVVISCSQNDDIIYFESKIQDAETLSVQQKSIEYSKIEIEILELVNSYRQKNGLSKLLPLDVVSSVAATHTRYMIENGCVNHDNFQNRSNTLIKNANASTVGENVGYGYGSAKGVVNNWLTSEAHRVIIENPNYSHFGISTDCNSEGRYYFTHIFIQK